VKTEINMQHVILIGSSTFSASFTTVFRHKFSIWFT